MLHLGRKNISGLGDVRRAKEGGSRRNSIYSRIGFQVLRADGWSITLKLLLLLVGLSFLRRGRNGEVRPLLCLKDSRAEIFLLPGDISGEFMEKFSQLLISLPYTWETAPGLVTLAGTLSR